MNKKINFGVMQFRQRSIKFTESILLIFIWLVLFLSPLLVGDSIDWKNIVSAWLRFAPYFILTVINHFVLIPLLFYKKKTGYFISALLLLAVLGITQALFFNSTMAPRSEMNNFRSEESFRHPDRVPPPFSTKFNPSQRPPLGEKMASNPHPLEMPPWVNSLIVGFLVIGFDIGLRSTFMWNKTEQERVQLEKEKVKSELAFLKNQLSPHFFMNTLNNIHSLIDIDTEEAKESIIRLSKLMRHLLYDSDEEYIPLEKEVQFIQSYVDLMKLRFTDKVKITFAVDNENNKLKIPPLLFTSLIENAFKYGVSYKQDSFIHIEFSTKDKELNFTIKNSKMDTLAANENKASGIGLENTRKRLDLLYASNYVMKIDETATTFLVELKLPI